MMRRFALLVFFTLGLAALLGGAVDVLDLSDQLTYAVGGAAIALLSAIGVPWALFPAFRAHTPLMRERAPDEQRRQMREDFERRRAELRTRRETLRRYTKALQEARREISRSTGELPAVQSRSGELKPAIDLGEPIPARGDAESDTAAAGSHAGLFTGPDEVDVKLPTETDWAQFQAEISRAQSGRSDDPTDDPHG
jgi:hypothetical protein